MIEAHTGELPKLLSSMRLWEDEWWWGCGARSFQEETSMETQLESRIEQANEIFTKLLQCDGHKRSEQGILAKIFLIFSRRPRSECKELSDTIDVLIRQLESVKGLQSVDCNSTEVTSEGNREKLKDAMYRYNDAQCWLKTRLARLKEELCIEVENDLVCGAHPAKLDADVIDESETKHKDEQSKSKLDINSIIILAVVLVLIVGLIVIYLVVMRCR